MQNQLKFKKLLVVQLEYERLAELQQPAAESEFRLDFHVDFGEAAAVADETRTESAYAYEFRTKHFFFYFNFLIF